MLFARQVRHTGCSGQLKPAVITGRAQHEQVLQMNLWHGWRCFPSYTVGSVDEEVERSIVVQGYSKTKAFKSRAKNAKRLTHAGADHVEGVHVQS